ncbi:MAG TPA: hypothetical protein VJ204_04405 [Solirubrobacterales bacterium]|nr:hypothetical protein [Solirubrobacterales bacterium]
MSAISLDWHSQTIEPTLDEDRGGAVPIIGPAISVHDAERLGALEPQAFRTEIGSGRDGLPPHFHPVDQFQYFVGGACRFGKSEYPRGVIHYTDRFAPYGPLQPVGPDGFSFVNLRRRIDFGLHEMPKERDTLKASLPTSGKDGRRRSLHVDLLRSPSDRGWTDLVIEDDGLRISIVDLDPGSSTSLPELSPIGAFAMVVSGSITTELSKHAEDSIAYCDSIHSGLSVRAGDEGARIALAQFPDTRPVGGADLVQPDQSQIGE